MTRRTKTLIVGILGIVIIGSIIFWTLFTTRRLTQELSATEATFELRLRQDNPVAVDRAGNGWRSYRLGTFYHGDETGVDNAVRNVARSQLRPGENLPQFVWTNLQNLISVSTRVSDVIGTVDSALKQRIEDAPSGR